MKWGASLSRPSHVWLLFATMVKEADFPKYYVALEEPLLCPNHVVHVLNVSHREMGFG
ncbi:hypothetical protein Acr_20g0002560 [Actinidia rufa]|uniref:Uncharacterized protein n=1 Tax=Actinidia rufa TaxID=165716 RepID=A0A7J0GCM0_9ERIC|nr:hypothetical protein Acr_20g0002560 [Actinidia rufa]